MLASIRIEANEIKYRKKCVECVIFKKEKKKSFHKEPTGRSHYPKCLFTRISRCPNYKYKADNFV